MAAVAYGHVALRSGAGEDALACGMALFGATASPSPFALAFSALPRLPSSAGVSRSHSEAVAWAGLPAAERSASGLFCAELQRLTSVEHPLDASSPPAHAMPVSPPRALRAHRRFSCCSCCSCCMTSHEASCAAQPARMTCDGAVTKGGGQRDAFSAATYEACARTAAVHVGQLLAGSAAAR